jgi:hypothetical protein
LLCSNTRITILKKKVSRIKEWYVAWSIAPGLLQRLPCSFAVDIIHCYALYARTYSHTLCQISFQAFSKTLNLPTVLLASEVL